MVSAEALPHSHSHPHSSSVHAQPQQLVDPDRVLDIFADGANDLLRLNDTLQREVDLVSERVVIPLVRAAWPDIDASGFMPKLRTCVGIYTHLGLSCVACSGTRPWPFAVLSRASRTLGLSKSTLASVVHVALPLAFRLIERKRAERLALASALIIVFDEALDSPDTPAPVRSAKVMAILEGNGTPNTPCLRALDAVWQEMRARLDGEQDARALRELFDLYRKWAEAEHRNVNGEPDPTGWCHRREAIIASMQSLAWAIAPYANDAARLAWLVHVAECGQMIDDLLDIEKDRREGRITPAQTGMWTIDTIRASFTEIERAFIRTLAEAGDTHGAYVDLCLMVGRAQMYRVTRILIDHP